MTPGFSEVRAMFPHLGYCSDVFSDRLGVLEGEQLVRGSSVRNDSWHSEQQVVSNDFKSCSQLSDRCLRLALSDGLPARGSFENWLVVPEPSSQDKRRRIRRMV